MRKVFSVVFFLSLGFFIISCSSYRQNIMFKTSAPEAVKIAASEAEKNYSIQKNDNISVDVYTNAGERIIDPDFKLSKDIPTQGQSTRPVQGYLINTEGFIKLPMVGILKLEGLTIRQAEEILQKEYSKYYHDPFVVAKYLNKRVVVLGAPGGQVIPLVNENVKLVEVLAMAKGLNNDAKAHNIRVIRGEQVFLVDFSTFEGYKKNNMIMEPGDVIYVEPIRRPLVEGVRDYGPFFSILTSVATLIVVIISLNN